MCATEDPIFAVNGNIGTVGVQVSDSASLSALRWFSTPECDRIDLSFSSSAGAPAVDPPNAAGVMLRQFGVIRISLGPTVTGSEIIDQIIESPFVEAAFIGRDSTGAVFVDLHLRAAAEARLTSSNAPAGLSIDLRAGGDAYLSTPIARDDIVLLDPTTGAVTAPIVATGYHRRASGLTAVLEDADGTISSAESGGAPDLLWTSYTFLFPNPAAGPATLIIEDSITTALAVNP